MLTLTRTKIVEIFVDCDDFMIEFNSQMSARMIGKANGINGSLSTSEVMAICILYHHSRTDCFKTFYTLVVKKMLSSYFPDAPSYSHFIKMKKGCLFELFAFLWSKRLAPATPEANFIDSKKLPSCHIKREKQHRVMEGLASKGKTSTGWFFGMKIHLVINEFAQPCRILVTGGSVADNSHKAIKALFRGLPGTFFGDRGYLTSLKQWLKSQGVELITKVRKNMKKKSLTARQKHYLKKRSLIETAFGLMAFQCDIDHTRHRSQSGFFINLFTGIIAYTYLDRLPTLKRYSAKEISSGNIVIIHD